ncbi:MAG: ABC transporter permease [Spirochaetales bacterium]|nr:ABC transporter permease [Spirochaetales bacterium]
MKNSKFLKKIRFAVSSGGKEPFSVRHPFAFFLASRISTMILMMFLLGLLVFGLMALTPGDAVDDYAAKLSFSQGGQAGTDNVLTEKQIEDLKDEFHLNDNFFVRYMKWLGDVILRRDLGRKITTGESVAELLGPAMRFSVTFNIIALFVVTILSFVIGIYFSSKAGSRIDGYATTGALILHSFPGLFMLILIQFIGFKTGIFPSKAIPDYTFSERGFLYIFDYLHHISGPLFAAFLLGVGGTMRMIRSTMLDQLNKPYTRLLRARGVSQKRIVFSHAFRNTLNPYVTSSANLFADLFSGSLLMEIIFSYPGVGNLTFEAVKQEDYNIVMANLMFISFLVMLGMIVSDIVLALIDPRIRYGKE